MEQPPQSNTEKSEMYEQYYLFSDIHTERNVIIHCVK